MTEADENSPQGFDDLFPETSGQDQDLGWGDADMDAQESRVPVLRFEVFARSYAILGEQVREIIENQPLTPLPGAPSYIEGIFLHRRKVIGVLDLGAWLQMNVQATQQESRHFDRIILVEHGSYTVGLRAHAVTTLEQWPESSLDQPIPDVLPSQLRDYTLATREQGGQFVALLDVRRVLEDAALRAAT